MEREVTPPEPEECGWWAAQITVTLKGDGINDDTAEEIITTHNEADDTDNGDGWLEMKYNHRDEGRMERIEAKAYAEGHKYADALLAIASKMGLTLTAATDVKLEWEEAMSGPDPDRDRCII